MNEKDHDSADKPSKYELFEKLYPRRLKRVYLNMQTPTNCWEEIPDTIVDAVLQLRGSIDGSCDPMSSDDIHDLVEHLKYRESVYGRSRDAIDSAILEIIREGIRIGEAELQLEYRQKDSCYLRLKGVAR